MNLLRFFLITSLFLWVLWPVEQKEQVGRLLAGQQNVLACERLLGALSPLKKITIREVEFEKMEEFASRSYSKKFDELLGQKVNFEEVVGVFASNLPPKERAEFFLTFRRLAEKYQISLHESDDWLPFQFKEKSENYLGFSLKDQKMEVTWGPQVIESEDHLFKLLTKFIDVYAHMQFVPITTYNLYHKTGHYQSILEDYSTLLVHKLVHQYFTFSAFEKEAIRPQWFNPLRWHPLTMLYRDVVVIPEGAVLLGALSIPQIGWAAYLIGSMASSSVQSIFLGGLWKMGLPDTFFLTSGWKKIYQKKAQVGLYEHIYRHLGVTQAVRFANLHVGNIQAIAFAFTVVAMAPILAENLGYFEEANRPESTSEEEKEVREILELSKLSFEDFSLRVKKTFSVEQRAEYEEFLDPTP